MSLDLCHEIIDFISTNMVLQTLFFSFLLVFVDRIKETAIEFSFISNIASLNQ